MGPKKSGPRIGYWVRTEPFEGGVEVPEEYEKPSTLYDELKIFLEAKKIWHQNPEGILNENDLDQKSKNALARTEWEDEIKEKLTGKKMWQLNDFKRFMDEKLGGNSSQKKLQNSEPLKKEVSVTNQTTIPSEEGLDEVEHFLIECNNKLTQEIVEREREKVEKNREIIKIREEAFDKGNEEISLVSKEKGYKAQIQENNKSIKKGREAKLKKIILDERKKAEEKLEMLNRNIKETKGDVEDKLSKMKMTQQSAKKLKLKWDSLDDINNSTKTITVLNMRNKDLFGKQPQIFMDEWVKLGNVQVLEISSWEEAVTTLEKEKDEEVIVFILDVKDELSNIQTDSIIDVTINYDFQVIKDCVDADKKKKKSWMVVIPPVPEKLEKVASKMADAAAKYKEVKVCDLARTEKERLPRKKEGGETVVEKELNEINCIAERFFVSVLANMIKGKERKICSDCGLIHPKESCSEGLKKENSKEKKTKEGNGEKELANKKAEDSNEEKQIGREKEDKNSQKFSSRGRKDVVRERQRTRSRSKGRENKNRKSSKDRNGRERNERELTEKCFKCFQNHTWDNCWVRPHFKCLICGDLGHNKNIHFPKKEGSKEMIDKLYDGKIKFET